MKITPALEAHHTRKVYRFEDRTLMLVRDWPQMTQDEVGGLVYLLSLADRVTMPRLEFPKRARRSHCTGDLICLAPHHRKRFIVLHEYAHYRCGDRGAIHGPKFQRMYLDLLCDHGGLPVDLLKAEWRKAGLASWD